MNTLPPSLLHTPSIANKTECLVTNGRGSFASLAINGGLSRKFHGLLIHSSVPPMDRLLTWHSCIETVDGQSLDARSWYEDAKLVRPNGERHLSQYLGMPVPTWMYFVGGNLIKKELFMVQGEETTYIRYTLMDSPRGKAHFSFDNYIHFRRPEDHRRELLEMDIAPWTIIPKEQAVSGPGIQLKLGLQLHGTETEVSTIWHQPMVENQVTQLHYPIEVEDQGYDHQDSSLKIQTMELTLPRGGCLTVVGTLESDFPDAEAAYIHVTSEKRERFHDDDFANDLAHSALQLVAHRASVQGKTILAGFPWFGDWGRDTMIALPGTTLATGRFEVARSILQTFAHYIDRGMLPNKFPDRGGEPLKYNTIDASLWYFWAIQQYLEYTGDWEFVKSHLYPGMKQIIDHHRNGTRYGIAMDDDGLITGGDAETQLTWMDVKFDGYAVTPRYGKAVEINALWYNALSFMIRLGEYLGDETDELASTALEVRKSFQRVFWNQDKGCCYDYVTSEGSFDQVRSNQIIAVSLPNSPLDTDQQRQVFDRCYRELYTPVGLRSLAPGEKEYRGRYYGQLKDRDLAYHQGTVWAWPMGPFIDAAMKVHGNKEFAEQLLSGMARHFYFEGGIYGVSEVFDADPPFTPRGCFHQAWSVAELLRVVHRYGLRVHAS